MNNAGLPGRGRGVGVIKAWDVFGSETKKDLVQRNLKEGALPFSLVTGVLGALEIQVRDERDGAFQ